MRAFGEQLRRRTRGELVQVRLARVYPIHWTRWWLAYCNLFEPSMVECIRLFVRRNSTTLAARHGNVFAELASASVLRHP